MARCVTKAAAHGSKDRPLAHTHTHLLPASMLRSCLLTDLTCAPAAATSRCISDNARASLRAEVVMPSCISRAYGRRMPAHACGTAQADTEWALLLLLLSGVQRAMCGVPRQADTEWVAAAVAVGCAVISTAS